VEWSEFTAFDMLNKACVFRKIIYVTLSWNVKFPQNILELRLSPKIHSQSYLHLKIQNTTFLCIKFPPSILSPLHSTRGMEVHVDLKNASRRVGDMLGLLSTIIRGRDQSDQESDRVNHGKMTWRMSTIEH